MGKSCGVKCNFRQRHKAHETGAQLKQDKPSLFYTSYRPKTSPFTTSSRRGWFEDLEQYVGMGFDRSDHQAIMLLCDREKGVFDWSQHVYSSLQNCPWRQIDMTNKQLNMVSYLLELLYD